MTITLRSIADALGGQVRGKEVIAPTPGHSKRDRGTTIRLAPGAHDGMLIHLFNGGWHEIAQIKDTLRAAGVLPEYDGIKRELTEDEKAAIKRAEAEREREKREEQTKAAGRARQFLGMAQPADPGHPYLARKNIAPERLWQGFDTFGYEGALLVPMQDCSGAIWNVQSIVPGRSKEKLYATGARTKGLFWWAGKAVDQLVIGEGVATVAAIRRATGLPVVAAMTASNLLAIACMIRERRPQLKLTIAADDDPAGIDAARRAAAETGAALALPEIAA